MYVNAYVMDTADFGPSIIEFNGFTKVLMRNGYFSIWSSNASPTAERFKNQPVEEGEIPSFSIPIGIIAGLHMDSTLWLPAPAEPLIHVPALKEDADIITVLRHLMANKTLDKKTYNLIIKIAGQQKISSLAEFIQKNTRTKLRKVKWAGEQFLDKVGEIAKLYKLELRES